MLRSVLTTAVATAALVLIAFWSVTVGTMALTPAQVVDALLGRGDEMSSLVVRELRLPRVLLGALTGAAVGAAAGALRVLTPVRLPDAGLLGIGPIAVLPCLIAGAVGLVGAVSGRSALLGITLLLVLGIGGAALATAGVLAASRWFTGGHPIPGVPGRPGLPGLPGLPGRFAGAVLVLVGVIALAIVGVLWALLGGVRPELTDITLPWNSLGILSAAQRPVALAAFAPIALGVLACIAAAVIARLTSPSSDPAVPSNFAVPSDPAAPSAPDAGSMAPATAPPAGAARPSAPRPHLAAVLVGGAGIALCVGTAAALAGGLAFAGLIAIVLARALAGRGPIGLTVAAAPLGAIVVLLADAAARIVVSPAEVGVGFVLLIVGVPVAIAVGAASLLLHRGPAPHQVVIMRNNA